MLLFAVTAEGDISIGIDGSMSDEVTQSLVLALALPSCAGPQENPGN